MSFPGFAANAAFSATEEIANDRKDQIQIFGLKF